MTLNSQPRSPSKSLLIALLITCGFIALFIPLDRALFPQVTLAPLFGAILLFGLSLLFRPLPTVACFLLTLPYVMLSMVFLAPFDPTNSVILTRFWVRTMTFVTVGIVSAMASYFRCRLVDMLGQTKQLLFELPVAVVLSNSSGRITWANPASSLMLGSVSLVGRHFLTVLPSDGTPIDYDALFNSTNSDAYVRRAVPDHGVRFMRLSAGRSQTLVTVLLPIDKEK